MPRSLKWAAGLNLKEVVMKSKDNSVYIISLVVMVGLVGFGLAAPEIFGALTKGVFNFLIKYLGWWYMLTMTGFVLFCLYLALSRYGQLKLGGPDDKPEFSTTAWFGMLFGAGMGIGLVFYGVAEPLYHFSTPPFGAEPGSAQAAKDAIRASFFHWCLHPWASFAVIALCMGYFQFRKGAPGLVSSLLLPILGPKGNNSNLGRAVDILTVFATAAGMATSIGLATLQVNSGLKYVFGLPQAVSVQLAILAVIGVIYTLVTISGIDKGIKFLGNLNLFLACLMAGLLFLLGPTLTIIETMVTGIGSYFQNFIIESFDVSPYGGDYKGWIGSWTIFYWAWWIAWAPFVGSFIARISRGRTVRQFVVGVLLVPGLCCMAWFSIFGGTALNLQITGAADLATVVKNDLSAGVFVLYEHIPFGGLMSVAMMMLIGTFLITSANASTFVCAMYSTQGDLNPPKKRMGIWGVLQAAFAFVLLLTGGLAALQTASITAAGPFSIIMVLACWCLIKALREDFPEGQAIK